MLALRARGGWQQNVEQRIQINVALRGKRDRQAGADRIAVAPPDPLAVEVAGVDQLGDDPLRCSLRYLNMSGDIPHPNAGVVCDAQQRKAMVGEEPKWPHSASG